MGNLYNKESILTALIDKSLPEHLSHIRGLKDVKTLILSTISSSNKTTDDYKALFQCPITKQELDGLHPFFAIWTTGRVISDRAIKELGTAALQEEYGPFSGIDLVKLLPVEGDIDDQRAAMHRRREQHKSNHKKDKKEKKSKKDKKEKKEKKHKKHKDRDAWKNIALSL